jgi:hypothetical protein
MFNPSSINRKVSCLFPYSTDFKMGLLVVKVAADLRLKVVSIDDNFARFSNEVQVVDVEGYLIHIWKEKRIGNPSLQRNELITYLCDGVSNKGDAWVYALKKSTNSVVDSDELVVFLCRMYENLGISQV